MKSFIVIKARKILRILVWILVSVITIFLILHTPPVRNLVKGVLSRTISGRIEGQLDIGRVSYRLWQGKVTLEEVEFVVPGLRIQVERLDASFFEANGMSLKITKPWIVLEKQPKRSRRMESVSPPAWMILQQIGNVTVENGHLEWGRISAKGEVDVSLRLERQNINGQSQEPIWSLISDIRCNLGNASPIPLMLMANLELQDENLKINKIQLDTGQSTLSAQGALYHSAPFAGNLKGDFQINETLAEAITPSLPVQGEVAGKFQIEIQGPGLTSSVDLESPHIVLVGSGPWNLKAKSRFDGKAIQLDSVVLSGYQGSIKTRGSINLKQSEINADIEIQNLDANSLASVWTRLPSPLASQLGAEIQFSLKNWEIDQAKADGFIQLDSMQAEGIPISGNVDIKLSKGQLSFDSKALKISAGHQTEGELDISGEIATDFSDLSMSARVKSKELRILLTDYQVNAEIEIDHNLLRITEAQILSGPGRMQIEGQIPIASSKENWDLSAKLESFGLPDLLVDFGYKMSAEGTLSVNGEAKDPVWSAALQSSILDQEQRSQRGSLSLRARGQGNEIKLEEFKADLGGGSLFVSGQYQVDTRNLQAQMKGAGFRIQEFPPLAQELKGLRGIISLDATLQGPVSLPNVQANLSLDSLLFEEAVLPELTFMIKTEGKRAEFMGFAAEQFLSGSCQLEGAFPLQLEIVLADLPINQMLSGFPDVSPLEVTSAKGRLRMNLPLRNPSELSYQAEIEAIAGAYGAKNWSTSAFNIDGDREYFDIKDFHLIEGTDFLDVNGRIPLSRDGDIEAQLKCALDLGLINSLLPESELKGQVNANIQVLGTRDKPRGRGDATLHKCSGNWGDLSWENLELQLTGSEHGFRLNTLSMNLLEGSLTANGHMLWTDTGLDSKISFLLDQLNLGGLLADRGTAQTPVLRVSGGGEIKASDLSLSGITGSGSFTRIDTDFDGSTISLQSPAEWSLKSGNISLSPTSFTGESTDFTTSFAYDTQKSPPEWNLAIQGTLNSALANSLIRDNNIRLSGETDIKIELQSREGDYNGQAILEGGRLRLRNPTLSVSQLKLQASFQKHLVEIIKMQGVAGTGQIEVSGRLVPDESGNMTGIDLQINAENVPLSLADGINSHISGETRLRGDAKKYTLSGSVILPRILFRQELEAGPDSLIHLERQLKTLEKEPSLLQLISLDLRAEVQELQIDNSLAQLSADGVFTIKGNLLMPVFDGSMQIKSGGSIQIGRGSVRIDEGRVTLENYPDRPLDVTFSGISRIQGILIELDVRGRTDNLQTQISAPYRTDLTQGDLATLLMTGRTSAAAVSEAGTVAAEALAANLGGMLQDQVGEKVYIDVSSDQSMFSYGSDPTTRFSLGHQVAPSLYVIYSTALNGTQSRGLLDFQPPLPFRLRYIVEEDGRHIIEANHTLGIRLRPRQSSSQSEPKSHSRMGTLSFEGESPLKQEELRKLSRLKSGKRYNYWEALQGAQRIRNKLVKLGFKSALVDFEERATSTEQMDVIYFLEIGKRINIVWAGDALQRAARKRIEAFWDGHMSEDMLVEILAKKAEYSLQAQRFYLAQVTPFLTKTENEITVKLKVDKGSKGIGVRLEFRGNDSLEESKLANALPKPTKSEFFEMVVEDTNLLRRSIHVLYASEGFLHGRVVDVQTEYAAGNQELFVTIFVDEGPQAMVASVNLPAEAAEYRGPDAPRLNLEVEIPFRIEDYVDDRAALSNFYRRQGFFQPQVSGILKPVDNKIAVYFTVDKGPRTRVGEIRMARPSRIRQSTLEKSLTLKKGDPIHPDELALSRKRLFETRAFQSVDIQTVASEEGPEVRDLVVDLIDNPEIQLNYGVRYTLHNPTYQEDLTDNDYSPFEIGGGFRFLNPFGYGHRYGASGYLFGKDQFYRLFYETDSFFGLRFPTQVVLSQDWLREIQITGLKSRINRITFQQHYLFGESSDGTRWGEKLRLQWNYSFRHIRLTPRKEQLASYETDRGSISLSLIGDTRDSFLNPKRGLFWSLTSEFSRKWLGSDVNYLKLYSQAYLFIPLGGETIWVSGLRLGAVPGDNPLLIIEDRFHAGGAYSVRGFPQYYLGPKNELGDPLGGQAVVIFNQELRFPLYKSFYGGIFYDTGNVFALAQQMSLKGLRHSAGLGLRYVLPFGPIRLDWAYVLDPKPGEKRYRFTFTIGHVF